MKTIEVVAAIIRKGDTVFATERGYGQWKDWWEFPGGKVEGSEAPEEALRREIREELDAEISVDGFLVTIGWDYPDFHLTMHCYMCSLLSDALHLNEHEAARWLDYRSLREVRWLPADGQLLPSVAAGLLGVDAALAGFIEEEIIPRYSAFDKAHREDHARNVVQRALQMASFYPEADRNMLYAAAACHDLGLSVDRKVHHLESGRIIRETPELRKWFSEEEIGTIAEAAEDHRASSDHEPRTVYGRLVAEADRLIEPEQIIRRTVQYGLSHYPELDKEGHWSRTLDHLHEKYYYGGYLKLWIPESPNAAPLEDLRQIIKEESLLRQIFERIWEEETPPVAPTVRPDGIPEGLPAGSQGPGTENPM